MDTKKVIAQNIRKYRKEQKMTQKDLADKIGVSVSAVSNWEKGNNVMTIDNLFDVCNALDVPISKMSELDIFQCSKYEQQMIINFREATPLDQLSVLRILNVTTIPLRLLEYARLLLQERED